MTEEELNEYVYHAAVIQLLLDDPGKDVAHLKQDDVQCAKVEHAQVKTVKLAVTSA